MGGDMDECKAMSAVGSLKVDTMYCTFHWELDSFGVWLPCGLFSLSKKTAELSVFGTWAIDLVNKLLRLIILAL